MKIRDSHTLTCKVCNKEFIAMKGNKKICPNCSGSSFKSIQIVLPLEPIDYYSKLVKLRTKLNTGIGKMLQGMIIEKIYEYEQRSEV